MNAFDTPRSPWLIRKPHPSRRMRLFCFSYAGGNAFNFLPWQAALDPAIEVCGVQLPARGARMAEPPITSMPVLLQALGEALSGLNDLPFAFFGHSVGALIAFECTRHLQRCALPGPERLFVSGCQAPRYRSPSRQLHALPDAELIDALRDYNGTPQEVLSNRELMALVLPTIRADFALAEDYRYRPGPLLSIPVDVLAGSDDDNKAPGQVEGWQEETSNRCRIDWFDGRHFFINSQRSAVLERINTQLTQALCV